MKINTKTIIFFSVLLLAGSRLADAKGGVLWIGAHPDDEYYLAPLFEQYCIRENKPCHFLVITDGGKGHCLIPGGCRPNVAEVRKKEMARSAGRFKADLKMLNLEDTPAGSPQGALEAWNESLGGGNSLFLTVKDHVKQVQPELVLTFDPRHGSSCHHDHRAVAELTIAAAYAAGVPKENILMAEYPDIAGRDRAKAFVQSDDKVQFFDAQRTGTWKALVDDMSIHKSQFSRLTVLGFYLAPAKYKKIPLLKVSDVTPKDPRYENLCP